MIAGHFATTLIARQKVPHSPLWLLLFSAIALDVVWLSLAFAGLETPSPSSWLQASLANIRVEMPYSHNLIPVVGWTIACLLLGWVLTRQLVIGLWCACLVFLHWLCDLLVGFQHYIIDKIPPPLGLNLYNNYPLSGIVIEAAIAALCVAWFDWSRRREGRPVRRSVILGMYVLFAGGALVLAPITHYTLSDWLGFLNIRS